MRSLEKRSGAGLPAPRHPLSTLGGQRGARYSTARRTGNGRLSVHVTSWVLKHSDTKLGARLVLLVIADHAGDDGTRSWCAVETIAHEARLSRSQVQRCLRQLESAGAIVETGKGPKGTHEYRVEMRGPQIAAGRKLRPEPSLVREDLDVVTHEGGVQGGEARRPARVDRKPVTMAEHRLATEVLDAWNRATGQSLRASATLSKIVMRIREYPDLGLAEHEHIIQVSLERPWWRGVPSPSVIYGNDAQFERQLAEASRSAHSEVQSAFEVAMRALNERSNP